MANYRFAWPPVTKTVIGISIVAFLGWFVPTIVEPVGAFVKAHLVLTSTNVVEDNELWTLLSYGVFHPDFLSALFSALAVWLFGTELQQAWSLKKFWGVQAGAVALGGIFAFAMLHVFEMETTVTGYHAAVIALLTAFCRRYWNRELSLFVVTLTGKSMLAFFLGLNILLSVISGAYYAVALDLGGVLVGWFAGDGPGLSNIFRDLRTRFNRWRSRRHLKVVRKTPDGEWIN